MATTLFSGARSDTSPNTTASLQLNSLTRSGSVLNYNVTLTIKLGSGTELGANNGRRLEIYNKNNKVIYSRSLKNTTTDHWDSGKTYTFSNLSFSYDTGVYSKITNEPFYMKIVASGGTGSTNSCLWVNSSYQSDRTYYTTIDAVNVAHIYTNDGWKQAVPYVYTNDGWKEAQIYVYTNNGWKLGG